jgi:hypothetical protein
MAQRERRVCQLEARYAAWEAEAFGAWLGSLSAPQAITFHNRVLSSLASVGLAPPLPPHLWEAPVAVRQAYLASLAQMMARDRLAVRQIIRQTWRLSAASRPL